MSEASHQAGAKLSKPLSAPPAEPLAAPHEAWITADPVRGGFKVLVTGPHGLERSVSFAMDENSGVITAHVRAALED